MPHLLLSSANAVYKYFAPPAQSKHIRLAVFAHANGFCKETFDVIVRRVQRVDLSLHCISVDLCGHGDSPEPEEKPFHCRMFGESILSCIDHALNHLGAVGANSKVYGIGHSIGATGMLWAETLRPGAFQSLCLTEPIVFPSPAPRSEDSPLAAMTRKRRNRFASPAEAVENWKKKATFSSWDPEILTIFAGACLRESDSGDYVLKCTPEFEASVYQAGPGDLVPFLKQIDCPVTYNVGGSSKHLDALHSAGTLDYYATVVNTAMDASRRLPVQVVPGAGHLAPMERPDFFVEQIVKQVGRLDDENGTCHSRARL